MESELPVSTNFSHYRIVSKIGAGGMGEVYRAHDTKLGRDVAIKVLPALFSENPERLSRFEQEAQAAGALNHPNILVIHQIGTHEGAPYIVSELLEGETLRERMGGVALPQRKAIEYALQIAQGLSAAHEKGIVHRDLKPENLFITKDGRIKILDFGLAKLTTGDSTQSQTEVPTRRVNTDPGTVMGTVGYMSPEQLRGRPADHRSDIFSFGAVLYEMLSGRRAFRGESTADTMSAILREEPPDLSGTNRNINPALERIVNHCLEKNPEERFHSARDLAFAIEALSGSTGASGSASTVYSSLPASKRKRRELFAWAIAGLFLISSVVLGWLYFQRSPSSEQPVRFVITTPENTIGVTNPVISPDGRTLAFLGTFEGRYFLYTRQLATLETNRLAGTDDARGPFWSPDSRHVAFFSNNKLKRIEAGGGPVQTLCDVQSAYGGSWNKEGVILISFDTKGIHRVSAAGGAPASLLKLDEARKELAQAWPVFLPDGRHFLYQSWNGRSDDSAIIVTSIDGGVRKLLLKADSNPIYAPGYLLFARGSVLMAQQFDAEKLQLSGDPFPIADGVGYQPVNSYANTSISENGTLVYLSGGVQTRELAWFDRTGKQLGGTVGSPGEYNDIVLSRDGKRLAMQRLIGDQSDVWLMDLAREGALSRFTFSSNTEDNPVWSPDGKYVAFSMGRESSTNIYRKVSSGAGNEEMLVESEVTKEPTDWSSDGRFLIFSDYRPKTGSDIWVLPFFGDGKPYALLETEFEEGQGHFSPDGKWFTYNSNESGRDEVYVQSFPVTGGKWLISTGGGSQPQWRGKEIFYLAPDKTLMSVEINAGALFESSVPKPLFVTQVNSYNSPNRYAVTVDGQRFMVNCPSGVGNSAPINVVLNWTSGLKR